MIEILAKGELRSAEIPINESPRAPFQLNLYHPGDAAKVWKKLPAEKRKELACVLAVRPFRILGVFDADTVVLRDDVIAADGDRRKLEQLAKDEEDIQKALVIIDSNPRLSFRMRGWSEVLSRDSVGLKDLLSICERIPEKDGAREGAYWGCYKKKNLSEEERRVIFDKAPGPISMFSRWESENEHIISAFRENNQGIVRDNRNSEIIKTVVATATVCIALVAALYSWLSFR